MATPIVSQSVYSPVVPAGSPAKPHASVYEIITSQILAKLERGAVPWRKPWHSLPPANLITKRPYRGINVFLLGFAGYGSQYALFFTVTSIALMFAQSSSLRVYSDTQHNVHVTSANGKNTTVASEAAQVGIDAIKVADDKQTAGWLALYKDPDGGSPVAGKLVLWRGGRIMRSFPTDQTMSRAPFVMGSSGVGLSSTTLNRFPIMSVPNTGKLPRIVSCTIFELAACWHRGMVIWKAPKGQLGRTNWITN